MFEYISNPKSKHYLPINGKEWLTFPGLYKKLNSFQGPSILSAPSRTISERPVLMTFEKIPYWFTACNLCSLLCTDRTWGLMVEFDVECKDCKGT